MKNVYTVLCLALPLLAGLGGCWDENGQGDAGDYFKTVNIADSLGLDSGTASVFLLPAPLQVVSVLKLQDVPYTASLISDIKPVRGGRAEHYNALNLGRNTIDMGYATLNSDLQLGLSYSRNIRNLMEELGIASPVTRRMKERFEANVDRQDSLSEIILEGYIASHRFFQHNQREGMGLLILTGCFVEGLYLASSIDEVADNRRLQGLLGIHKEYLNNLLLLLRYYNDHKDVAALIEQLEALAVDFQSVELVVNAGKGSASLNRPVSAEKVAAIREKISVIRNQIMG